MRRARFGVIVVLAETRRDGTALFEARCSYPQCTWRSPKHVVKAGASEAARWHRNSHRPLASPAGRVDPVATVPPVPAPPAGAGGAVTSQEPR